MRAIVINLPYFLVIINHLIFHHFIKAICMFVQQMHYYNTVIEDLPNSDSHNQETSQIDESHNDAIDKLRIYECRALNLFRYQSDAKSSILYL